MNHRDSYSNNPERGCHMTFKISSSYFLFSFALLGLVTLSFQEAIADLSISGPKVLYPGQSAVISAVSTDVCPNSEMFAVFCISEALCDASQNADFKCSTVSRSET